MSSSKLSFRIELSTETFVWDANTADASETVALPVALVRALVDGVEPLQSRLSRPFDAVAVLLYGAQPGEHDFYTCSCGVAGCAGLHEGIQVQVSETRVTWTFPMRTYQKVLEPSFAGASGPELAVVFDKKQYLGALQRLRTKLKLLARTHPHLQVPPCSQGEDPRPSAFEVIWPACVQQAARDRANARAYRRVFGELVDQSLVLRTPLGVFTLSPAQWRVAMGLMQWSDELHDFLLTKSGLRRAIQVMRTTRGEPLAFARSLAWDALQLQARFRPSTQIDDCETKGPSVADVEDVQLPEAPLTEFWDRTEAHWEA